MAIAYVTKGSNATAATGSVNPTALQHNVGDFLLLLAESDGTAINTPAGYTSITSKNNGLTATSGANVAAFWRIADGTSADNPSVTTSSGTVHINAVILTFTGVAVTNPIDGFWTAWLDNTPNSSHAFTGNATTSQNGSMAILIASTSINAVNQNLSQTSTSLSGFTNLGRIALGSGTGSDTGNIGVGYGTQDTLGTITGTYTATWSVASNAVGIGFCLKQQPNELVIASPAMKKMGMTAVLTNGLYLGAAPAMKKMAFAGVFALKDNVVLNAAMKKMTFAGVFTVKNNVVLSAAMGKAAFAGILTNGLYLDMAGAMGKIAFSGALSLGQVLTAAPAMGKIGFAGALTNGLYLDLAGAMGKIAMAADLSEVIELDLLASMQGFGFTADAILGQALDLQGAMGKIAFEGDGVVGGLTIIDAALVGSMGKIGFAATGDFSFIPFPTDTDFVIVVEALERSIIVPALDRSIVIPALNRTIQVPNAR